ncbi:hypothetical protein Dimus_006890 [Dionaea muscipula]
MCNKLFLAILLLFFVVADVASAAFSSNFRILVASAPKQSPNVIGSPMASPGNGTSATPQTERGLPIPRKDAPVTPPIDGGNSKTSKEDQVKEKDETKVDGSLGSNGTCNGIEKSCRDSKSLVACITTVDDESKMAVLLIQNQGDIILKVNLTFRTSDQKKELEIAEHQAQQINISLNGVSNFVISLNAGYGDCILQLGPSVSKGNLFKWLPPPYSYSKLLTPMYGAYLLLLAILVVGGVWACCQFRRRKHHNEIPYQELEMGMPESSLHVETAEGWDQGWDDDWDADKAVRSPGARHAGSISASGLVSRSANRDGWEEWEEE